MRADREAVKLAGYKFPRRPCGWNDKSIEVFQFLRTSIPQGTFYDIWCFRQWMCCTTATSSSVVWPCTSMRRVRKHSCQESESGSLHRIAVYLGAVEHLYLGPLRMPHSLNYSALLHVCDS
jgi:hypothetical protein